MYCEECGEKLKPDAKYCNDCGTKVKETNYKETDFRERPMESQREYLGK